MRPPLVQLAQKGAPPVASRRQARIPPTQVATAISRVELDRLSNHWRSMPEVRAGAPPAKAAVPWRNRRGIPFDWRQTRRRRNDWQADAAHDREAGSPRQFLLRSGPQPAVSPRLRGAIGVSAHTGSILRRAGLADL